jgi:tryptophanyl-tRNA synthetase
MRCTGLKRIALSGIKPTGELHIGNYLGMIKPAFELAQTYQALYFIADYHALTTVKDAKILNHMVYDVAATLVALGLDTDKIIFFRQADIPEIFELTWIGKPVDADINAGLYNYPVLMTADILLYGSHAVPVGQDQKQHVEIARDIASSLNCHYGEIFTLPQPLIQADVMSIPGIDGRKMSKNNGNTIIYILICCRLMIILMSFCARVPKKPGPLQYR